MYRFFVDKIENNLVKLSDEQVKHLKVIRKINSEFLVNYNGNFYVAKIENPPYANVIKSVQINHEFKHDLTVFIPLIDWKRFEILLEKCVELGAKKIIPFESKFTNFDKSFFDKKRERFSKIILASAQQSFRNIIPELCNVIKFKEIEIKSNVSYYLADSEQNSNEEINLNKINSNSALIVGPEGGFDLNEIELAKSKNINIVSLGKTILRAETAMIKMLSLVSDN
ncbi:16S rRNA (uracil1498-N3)-methyltransferase [Mycoplasma testudineum]|uniref:Ribosomal RNA small subunit methyltransferase E n=1 Tax=Mycoplasma testudineum TaxID=244584 RepID=A0A4V3C380_9MOLU|nr:16S rRNA (uracil(1498)-N(3))-methyltransferase [Mycoplasma testudineum]OYD27173.1 16S rRNA (uracil(1498)-N(3))-methyltransferase [Mycoplasma testudineum]TDO21069.1 16S rRNA (uracil1498-N3)-methyltransferase [Mycoplasma testudineum]